jgi:hypothetical protein
MLVLKARAKKKPKTFAGALTSVLLHVFFALAPSPWNRGGANKPVLESLQSLAR